MSSKEKTKGVEMAISQIEKSFGKGAIMRLGAEEVAEGIRRVRILPETFSSYSFLTR